MAERSWRDLPVALQMELFRAEVDQVHDMAREIAVDHLNDRPLEDIADDWLRAEMEEDRDPTPDEIAAWIEENTRCA